MAYITLDRKKFYHNYMFLDRLFKEKNISWAGVSKLLCGNKTYLQELIDTGITEICDARVENLKTIKELAPNVDTVYIRPPSSGDVANIIRYADASFNTEFATIKMLSEEAKRQNKVHKVIIMIELGDLREGIMGDHLMDFYGKVFELPNITVTGIGANLNCLYGVMPSEDKLVQLSLYKQLIEVKFNRTIPWVTGGTSVVLPMISRRQLPSGINHFRVGEALYFGNNMITGGNMEGMEQNIFKLYAEIIEITEKPKIPSGTLEKNPSGEVFEVNEEDYGKTSYRAILDVGLLDISPDFLIPDKQDFEISGASSDMLVVDLGESKKNFKVGDMVSFNLKYMGALRLLNSDYIEKRFIGEVPEAFKKRKASATIRENTQQKNGTKPNLSPV